MAQAGKCDNSTRILIVGVEGILRYREVEDEVQGTPFKHRSAEVHATSMKRLSKIETADDPADGAGDE